MTKNNSTLVRQLIISPCDNHLPMPLAVEYYLSSSTWIAREKACVRQLTFDSAAVTESRGKIPRAHSHGVYCCRAVSEAMPGTSVMFMS